MVQGILYISCAIILLVCGIVFGVWVVPIYVEIPAVVFGIIYGVISIRKHNKNKKNGIPNKKWFSYLY